MKDIIAIKGYNHWLSMSVSFNASKIVIILSALFLITAITLLTFFYLSFNRTQVGNNVSSNPQETPQLPTPTPDPLGAKNIALLGYAGGNHDGATLTDTIIIAHVEPRNDKITFISVPRDIWVPLEVRPGENEHFKINHAYAIGLDDEKYPDKPSKYLGEVGAITLAKDTLETVTGLKIDNVITINFQGFKNVINTLGGVDINVPQKLDDEYYPIEGEEDNTCDKSPEEIEALEATMSGDKLDEEFKCRYEHLVVEKGYQTLDADLALKYVRSRHSQIGGNDFGRSRRQLALLTGIKNKLLNIKNLPKIISVIDTLSKNSRTDIDLTHAYSLLNSVGGVKDVVLNSISLDTDNVLEESKSSDGQYILVAKGGSDNWDEIHKFIEENLR